MLGEGRIVHAGDDAELAAHVLSTAAAQTDRGWKISKIRQRQRIDALVAAVMANYGAILQTEGEVNAPGFYAF
jgi:phage terminase large subunit-like protein